MIYSLYFALGFAVISGYAMLDRVAYLLPWFVTGIAVTGAAHAYDRRTGAQGRFCRLVLGSYLAISVVGLILVGDNLRNFATELGSARDDSTFFLNTVDLVQHRRGLSEAGPFEWFLSFLVYLPLRLVGDRANVLMLLPINWALAGWVVGLCDSLCRRVLARGFPVFIVVATVLLNYRFMDSTARLYRDGLMLCFLLVSLMALVEGKYLRSMVWCLPVGLLRVANALLVLPAFGTRLIVRRIRSAWAFYLVVGGIALAGAWCLQAVGPMLLRYGTQITRLSGGNLPAYWTLSEHLAFRQEVIRSAAASGSTLESSLAQESAAAYLVRPVIYTIFPIRFWPLAGPLVSNSPLADVYSVDNGVSLGNVVEWVSIPAWLVALPLMMVGFWEMAFGRGVGRVFCVYYLSTLLFVTFISCELRHSLAFIILHPLLAGAGWEACRRSSTKRSFALAAAGALAYGFIAFNLRGGSAL